jgi:hypothetical protein
MSLFSVLAYEFSIYSAESVHYGTTMGSEKRIFFQQNALRVPNKMP